MASIPGVRFDVTGASGSQGLLSPMSGWFCYIFPRGGYASQDSTGTTITFDSSAVASRFAANNWIQVGLSTANIRKVNAVGGNSITVQGSAVTVAENDRIFLIGNTQPTVTGGSATYTIPSSVIRQRDDDSADIYTNSMVTTTAQGLVQFFSEPSLYDCIVQDGNQSNQGSIIDLAVGAVEGISTSSASIFGATVTFLAGVSANTTLVLGQTFTALSGVSINGNLIVGGSLTVHGAIGVTGWATFGSTITGNAALGITGWATLGASVTISGAVGITGTLTVGQSSSFRGAVRVFGVTLDQRASGDTYSRFELRADGSMYFGDATIAPVKWGGVGLQIILAASETITLGHASNFLEVTRAVSGATFTMTSTPTVEAGTGGEYIRIINAGNNTITLQDAISGLSGTTLRLGASTRALGPRDSIKLWYNGEWWEVGFSNV